MTAVPTSQHGRTEQLSLQQRPTILHLPHAGLEVVQRQVRHLLLDVVQVHREDVEWPKPSLGEKACDRKEGLANRGLRGWPSATRGLSCDKRTSGGGTSTSMGSTLHWQRHLANSRPPRPPRSTQGWWPLRLAASGVNNTLGRPVPFGTLATTDQKFGGRRLGSPLNSTRPFHHHHPSIRLVL